MLNGSAYMNMYSLHIYKNLIMSIIIHLYSNFRYTDRYEDTWSFVAWKLRQDIGPKASEDYTRYILNLETHSATRALRGTEPHNQIHQQLAHGATLALASYAKGIPHELPANSEKKGRES